MGCAMLYVGLYVRIKPPVKGADIPGAGYMALVCIYLFAGFFQWGWGPVPWIYISEIPTARLRSVNVALGAATQWVSLCLKYEDRTKLTFCLALQPGGRSCSSKHARHNGKSRLWHIPLLLGSLFPLLLLCLVLVSFIQQPLHWSKLANTNPPNSIPETKGLSLEKMDDLFGVTELAKKIEDEEGAHNVSPAKDFEGEKTQHVEISQVNSNTKH